jgi:hypothetical protein
MIQDALKRPGPAPRLSESEVITLALHQELIGEPREDHFFRPTQVNTPTPGTDGSSTASSQPNPGM